MAKIKESVFDGTTPNGPAAPSCCMRSVISVSLSGPDNDSLGDAACMCMSYIVGGAVYLENEGKKAGCRREWIIPELCAFRIDISTFACAVK